jgi:hypothetical protein
MNESTEYSLAQLLEHPVLGVLLTSGGLERRSLGLILDAESGDRRRTETEPYDPDIADYRQ